MKCSAIDRLVRFGRDPTLLLIVVLAGLGTAHVLVRTATYGAGVRPDSIVLLSTALNFLAGEGWRDYVGRPLTLWLPLFPLLLAAFGWVGIDPLAAGRWVNAAAFGLTILAAGCWLRANLRSRWLGLTATTIIAASLPLSHWAAHLMTESLFVLFTVLALMQLASFLNRKTDAPLWWAAVFTALAALTRYPGVVLIGTGVLVLLPVARWKQTLVFGAVSSVPLLAVLARNWAVTGNLSSSTGQGRRGPSGESLSDGLSRVADVFREWVVPPNAPDGLAYLLSIAAGLVVLAAGAVVVQSGRGVDKGWLGPVVPFGVFAAIYLVFMVAIVPFLIHVPFPFRYLLPVYVPLLLMAALLLDRFLSIEATGRMRTVRYVVGGSLVVLAALSHIGFSARQILHRIAIAQAGKFPGAYDDINTARWRHSETLKYVGDNPIEGTIYTNQHRGYIKRTWFWHRTVAPDKPRCIPETWDEIEVGAYIVLFGESYKHGYDILFRDLPGVDRVAELADGVVYRRTTANPAIFQQADDHVVRAGWSVYRIGRKLLYFKNPCGPEDVQAKFVLHVVPTDPADLPAHRKQYGSENLDFYFDQHGKRIADQCMVVVPLPAYPISRIYIGQWISAENRTVWEAELTPSR